MGKMDGEPWPKNMLMFFLCIKRIFID